MSFSTYSQLPITRELEDTGDPNIKKLTMRFPQGYIEYRGENVENEPELKNRLFGLSFQRPERTNGGWDLWKFLNVILHVEGKPIPIIHQHLLDQVEILENESRMLIKFRWHMEERNAALNVFLAWYPAQADWVFVKVQAEGETTSLHQVIFSAFPGNSAGPEERERWFATNNIEQKLSMKRTELPTDTQGVVFFNKLAQQDAGCLLVFGNMPIQTLKVLGSYNVLAETEFNTSAKEATFALGGFIRQKPEEIIRVFNMEAARNTANFLESIDWTPKIDKARHQILMQDIEILLTTAGNDEDSQHYQEWKNQYAQESEKQDPTRLLEIVSQMDQLKQELIATELAKLK